MINDQTVLCKKIQYIKSAKSTSNHACNQCITQYSISLYYLTAWSLIIIKKNKQQIIIISSQSISQSTAFINVEFDRRQIHLVPLIQDTAKPTE